jgi:hypothetical protein
LTTAHDLWRRGQRGWPERYPLVQFPNAPLIVAFAAALVARITDGTVQDVARLVTEVGVIMWALMEIARGSNAFRRVLGAVVLALVVVSRLWG